MSDVTTTTLAPTENLYALVAEFDTAEEALAAAHAVRTQGYSRTDAYTPFAVEGLDEALGMKKTRIGWVMLLAGTAGAFLGFFMQWFANVVHYPLNIGGRPLNSWPNFIIITFEVTALSAALAVAVAMIFRNGMPRLYHPIFNTPNFERATRDGFFISIEANDPKFELEETRRFLEGLSPARVSEVER